MQDIRGESTLVEEHTCSEGQDQSTVGCTDLALLFALLHKRYCSGMMSQLRGMM